MNAIDLINQLGVGCSGSHAILAYIDPGTGSYVFQMLVAGALTVVVTLKNFRSYIGAKLGALFGRKSEQPGVAQSNSEAKPGAS